MKLCWNITTHCNKNCRFCFRDTTTTDNNLEQNITVLNNLKKLDVTKITYAGGEPFLYDGLEVLLKISKENGIYNKIVTNGSLLNANNIEKKLKYVDRIAFSVDSSSDLENYFLGRGSEQYSHIKEIVPLILKKYPKMKIDINTTIVRQTLKEIDSFYNSLIDNFSKKEIARWKILRFCPLRGNAKDKSDEFTITDEEFYEIKKKYNSIDSPFAISFVDNNEMVNKVIVNSCGILETYNNGNKITKDLNNINMLCKNKYNPNIGGDFNINLNLYKTFFDVARYGSLSLASKKMLISQPAISKSIKKLEEDLDVNLFYRTINGMVLTEKGKELYGYVEDAYNSLKTAQRSMLESNNMFKGKLIIGVPSHIASFFLFDKIKEFHKIYPQIEISIISRPTSELLKRLEAHELDFIIDASPIDTSNKELKIEKLTKVKHCFAALKKHNYNNAITCLRDLEDYPLIIPVETSSHRKKLNDLLFNHNVNIKNTISIETSEMIRDSILEDLGIGYIIEDAIKREIENGQIEVLHLEEELPIININLVYIEKYLTTIPKYFINNYLK